jgi:hypothetical protein
VSIGIAAPVMNPLIARSNIGQTLKPLPHTDPADNGK